MLVLPARSRLHPLRSAFHASLRSQHKSKSACASYRFCIAQA